MKHGDSQSQHPSRGCLGTPTFFLCREWRTGFRTSREERKESQRKGAEVVEAIGRKYSKTDTRKPPSCTHCYRGDYQIKPQRLTVVGNQQRWTAQTSSKIRKWRNVSVLTEPKRSQRDKKHTSKRSYLLDTFHTLYAHTCQWIENVNYLSNSGYRCTALWLAADKKLRISHICIFNTETSFHWVVLYVLSTWLRLILHELLYQCSVALRWSASGCIKVPEVWIHIKDDVCKSL